MNNIKDKQGWEEKFKEWYSVKVWASPEMVIDYFKRYVLEVTIPKQELSNKEDFEAAAENYAGGHYVRNHYPKNWVDRNDAFKAGASWANNQPNNEVSELKKELKKQQEIIDDLVREAAKHFLELKKQGMI